MLTKQNKNTSNGLVVLILIFLNAIVLQQGFISNTNWYRIMAVTCPVLLLSLTLFRHKKL